jgi:glycosyltransferase involved in cell wall biosynthesis
MPQVSVIIPAYNAGKYLEETVRSVLAQTFADLEIIICDDGSTDDTATIAQSFSDPRVKYIHQKNAGVSSARNCSAAHSTGEYLAFLDADDLFHPANLEKKVAVLEQQKDVALVFADCIVIDANGKVTGEKLIGKDENVLHDLLLWNGTVIPGPSSILVRRTAFEALSEGFDPRFSTAADQDFFFRIAAKNKCARIPEVLTSYRKHESNMHMNIEVMERDHIGVYEKANTARLFSNNSFRKKCFGNLYLILAGSWWVNGRNKMRAIKFMGKAVANNPALIFKLLRKLA